MGKNKTPQKWTKSELEILINNYPIGGSKVVKSLLPFRTLSSIRHKANRLNIDFDNNSWTQDEINIITKNYLIGGRKLIHKLLPHRTMSSIKTKVYELKLTYDTYHDKNDWSNEEIKLIKKWYPLLGIIKEHESKNIIGTSRLLDMLPNRTKDSIRNKAYRLNLKYNPQKGVPKGRYRCILCLIVKGKENYNSSMLGIKSYRCKDCQKIIHSEKYKNDSYRQLINNFISMNIHRTGKSISYSKAKVVVDIILERHESNFPNGDYRCYYNDKYCETDSITKITLGHKIPSSMGGSSIDPNNLFLICKRHNALMSDLSQNDFIIAMKSMGEKVKRYLSKS